MSAAQMQPPKKFLENPKHEYKEQCEGGFHPQLGTGVSQEAAAQL